MVKWFLVLIYDVDIQSFVCSLNVSPPHRQERFFPSNFVCGKSVEVACVVIFLPLGHLKNKKVSDISRELVPFVIGCC